MLAAGGAALLISVLGLTLETHSRDIVLFPWAVLLVLAVVDLVLSATRAPQLQIDMVPEAFVGETHTLSLTLTPGARGMRGRIKWPDGLSGAAEFPLHLDANGNAQAKVDCRATRRGVWSIDRLWLAWRSRLGLFDFVPRIDTDVVLGVVPNIRLVQSGEITTTVQSALFGVKENRAIGEGSEFHQLRDFTRGMDVSMIDWKRSARRRALVAKEMRAERNHHVIIAIDNGYLMREEIAGMPRIDHAITAALATAWAASVGGDLVGYYSYDARPNTFVAPAPGRVAFARLRSWTAGLDYVSRETNHTLALSELNARTPKRSLIIVFTDFVDATSAELLIENIAILAKRHAIIFVTLRDPQVEDLVARAPQSMNSVATLVAADQSIAERRLVQERIARLGVTVVDARPNTVTAQLIGAYLDIKAREMI